MIKWLKSLSWVAVGGVILAAIGMVLNARRAGKIEADVEHGEAKIKELQDGTKADINEAHRLQISIDSKKTQARTIRKKSEKSLERIGQDETMADIAKRFNGKRVRRRKTPTT